MYRWLRIVCALGVWAVLACAGAHAAASHFDATVQADGRQLGTASGTVDVTSAANGKVTWTLSDGRFTAAHIPDASVVWDDAILSGTGTADAGETITLKDFTVTLTQTTGVDITYRFRITVSLSGGAVKDVSITQMQ